MNLYLDNAATTKPTRAVIEDIAYALTYDWYNPSSTYQEGINVKRIVEQARKHVALSINADPEEIIFTSCGSESNNLAIKGYLDSHSEVTDIITTAIEHPSVYNTCGYINGYVHYTKLDDVGCIVLNDFDLLMETYPYSLVSIMMANNEIGTVQPVKEISKIVHKHGGVLHVDAVQAYSHINIDVKNMGIDMLSVSGHKFGLPKGIGFLYKNKDIHLSPIIYGGHQESNLRAGTENVPYIYALGMQVERLSKINVGENEFMLSKYLESAIYRNCLDICNVHLNGSKRDRIPNNLSLTFEGINAEKLITLLNLRGICVSAGSACCSGEATPSRVLKAIGLTDEEAFSTIRVTINYTNTFKELDYFVEKLVECLKILKEK